RWIGEVSPLVRARFCLASRLHDMMVSLLTVDSLRKRALELMQQTNPLSNLGVRRAAWTSLSRVRLLETRERRADFAKPGCEVGGLRCFFRGSGARRWKGRSELCARHAGRGEHCACGENAHEAKIDHRPVKTSAG